MNNITSKASARSRVLRSLLLAVVCIPIIFSVSGRSFAQTVIVTDPADELEKLIYRESLGVPLLESRTSQLVGNGDGKGIAQIFDDRNNLEYYTDEEGRVTFNQYNATNQRRFVTEGHNTAEARTTEYEYVSDDIDIVDKIIEPSVVSGYQKVTDIHYRTDLNPEYVIVTGYRHRPNTAVEQITRRWDFGYNAIGQVETIDGPRTDVLDITTINYYDCNTGGKCGNPSLIRNALGHETTYDVYNDGGQIEKMTDPNGLVTTYTYDGWYRVKTITRAPEDGSSPRVFGYTYYPNGQVKTVTDGSGATVTYFYDPAMDLEAVVDELDNRTEYKYDTRGNLRLTEKFNPGETTAIRNVILEHDLRSRLKLINNAGAITQTIRDAVGNIEEYIDPVQNPTETRRYDLLDRLQDITDRKLGYTDYGYDVQDNLTQVISPNLATTNWVYDDLGNLLSEDGPDRGLITYEHDNAGNVEILKDGRDVSVDMSYDALNRLVSRDYPGTEEDETYTYDTGYFGVGRLTTTSDQSGLNKYFYNAFGNIERQDFQRNGLEGTYTFHYKYDGANRLLGISYPDSRDISYVRNAIGQLETVTTSFRGATRTIVSNRTYRGDGLLSSQNWGSGFFEERVWDQRGQLDLQNLYDGIAKLTKLDERNLVFDDNGNVDSIDLSKNNVLQDTFIYDYDELDRIIEDTISGTTESLGYDGNGNRVLDGIGAHVVSTTSNRLSSSYVGLTNGDGLYIYDGAGNITSYDSGRYVYEYNERGRLERVTEDGLHNGEYSYDSRGLRTSKLIPSASELEKYEYFYDPSGNLLMELKHPDSFGAGSTSTVFIRDGLIPLAQLKYAAQSLFMHPEPIPYETIITPTPVSPGLAGALIAILNDFLIGDEPARTGDATPPVEPTTEALYLYSDYLGTSRLAFDDNQAVVWTWQGKAFGSSLPNQDPDGNNVLTSVNLRFAGQYFDSSTGLHYNWNRYYNPQTGRYVTSDPIGLDGGLNTYLYVSANPIAFTDPYGLFQFGERPLGDLSIGVPLPGNIDLKHENGFYENGDNVGFFKEGIRPDKPANLPRYDMFGPYYEDDLMREAQRNLEFSGDYTADLGEKWWKDPSSSDYDLFNHNCQDFADGLRDEYKRLGGSTCRTPFINGQCSPDCRRVRGMLICK